MSIHRITIANISAHELANRAQADKINGTINASIGVGAWGQETGATLETTDPFLEVLDFTLETLVYLGEKSAYVTVNGSEAYYLNRDGSTKRI